uniref:amidohydrolase family protein n=1 Tax=Sphingomonas bacterium TaxID=1895847 RepID=UPI0026213E8C|nr:amidohydrolase family protein [Sphingomonas bacterium]
MTRLPGTLWRQGLRLAPAMLLGFALAVPAQSSPPEPRTPPWRVDPFASTYTPLPRTDFIITHATILDGAGKRIDDGEVLVRGGRIVAVGRNLPDRTGARMIDAHGRWVTPGVIDVHSHNGTYVVPLTDIDRDSSDVSDGEQPNVADTWVETAINVQDTGFSRALEGGVTTLQVLPGSSPIFSGRAVVLKPITATTVSAMKFPGAPQGFKMACGENPKQRDAEAKNGPTSRQGEVAFIRNAFVAAQKYRDAWDRYASGAAAAPPERDLKVEALAGILAGDIHVNMHCYRSDDMATMLAVAREFGFHLNAFHHAGEAYKIPGLIRAADMCVAVFGDWWGWKMEALDDVRANAPLLDHAGVCVTMHSDSPQTGQRLNIEAAKAGGAGRALGIDTPPERMIRWITSNPARMLGLSDRIGTLAAGYDADLVLWSGDPFSIYTKADLVVIDGAVAFDRASPPAHSLSDFELGRTGSPRP